MASQPQQQQQHLLASSESYLFAKRDEAYRLVQHLASTAGNDVRQNYCLNDDEPHNNHRNADADPTATANNNNAPVADLSQFRTILDGYQECPTLLDAHLERMASALAQGARDMVHELFVVCRCSDSNNNNDGTVDEAGEARTATATATATAACLLQRLRYPLSALYALSKVRGRKQVQKFLPHGTDDVEPVLHVLRLVGMVDAMDRDTTSSTSWTKDDEDHCTGPDAERSIALAAAASTPTPTSISPKSSAAGEGMAFPSTHSSGSTTTCRSISSGWDATTDGEAQWWESTYVLLMWLGMLSLVPFDLTVMDSRSSEGVNDTKATTLASSILSTSRSHLSDPGPTRDAAAACLASLLSRPDLESHHLEAFAHWSHGVMDRYLRQQQHHTTITPTPTPAAGTAPLEPYDPKLPLLIIGTVQTLAQIYKSGTRSNLMGERHLITVERLWTSAILVADAAAPSGRGGSKEQ